MKKYLILLIPIISLLLVLGVLGFSASANTVAASPTAPDASCSSGPVQDTYIGVDGTHQELETPNNGRGLKTIFVCTIGGFCPTPAAGSLLRYDVGAATQPIDAVTLVFTTTEVYKSYGAPIGLLTFSLSEANDNWGELSTRGDANPWDIMNNPPTVIETVQVNLTAPGQSITFNSPALAAYFENSRSVNGGNNLANVALRLVGDNAMPTGFFDINNTRVTFGDKENPNPLNRPSSSCSAASTPSSAAPGGVGSGTSLELWLKANAGTDTVVTDEHVWAWDDQSGNGYTATDGGGGSVPTFQNSPSGQLNFNPLLNYWASDRLVVDGIDMSATSNGSIFTVFSDFSGHAVGLRSGAADAEDPQLWLEGSALQVFSDSPIENASITNPRAVVAGVPHIGRTSWLNSDSTATELALDGSIATGDLNIDPGNDVSTGHDLDADTGEGNIAEVIIYKDALTAIEKNQVESYLAIKYGITLTGTQGISYTLSNASVVWNATINAAYHNDLAGIALDNGSALTQNQSHSVNSDALVTVSGTIGTDLSAMLWGNNDGTTTVDQIAGNYEHMARVWKVSETGSVGNVTIMIPDSTSAAYLLIDTDTDFSIGATPISLTSSGGMLSAEVDFTNGQYFTFANDAPPPSNALSLSKTAVDVNGSPLYAGDEILYTMTVTNELGIAQNGVTIADALPAYTTFVAGSATVTQGSVADPDLSQVITATVGSLTANNSATMTFRATVNANATGQTIQNTARAASLDNPTPIIEVGPITTADGGKVMPSADLEISQSIELDALQTIYTIVADNHGPADAPGAVISVTFPAEFTKVSWTCAASSGAVCPAATGSGNTINETVATFPENGKLTYTVRTTIWEAATNLAEVIPPTNVVDPDTTNNISKQTSRYLVILPIALKDANMAP